MTRSEKKFAHGFYRLMCKLEGNRRRYFRKELGMSETDYYRNSQVIPSKSITRRLANECKRFQS